MRKITKHFTQKQEGGVYMGVSLPTIPGSSVGDPGPSDLLHCRTSVMTTLSVTMVTITCFTMVAILLTTVMAVPAQGSQNSNDQTLEPGQEFDPCEFEGRLWQFGEKFESYDKTNRCKRVCFCQGNTNGVYCEPGCTR